MTDSKHAAILRRMTRRRTDRVADNPLTSSRAVRLALAKAAQDTVRLALTVLGVAEEVIPLDDMIGALGDDLMLVELRQGDRLSGVLALDTELRAAVVEMQTVGALIAQKAAGRDPTGTDKALCDPLVTAFLDALPAALTGTNLEGWVADAGPGDRLRSARLAGLVLQDRMYRVVRMTVDIGVADRQGLLLVALPLIDVPELPFSDPPKDMDWHATFQVAVSDAPIALDALLFRFRVPLAQAREFNVGTVVPLPGCTVNSVRLIAPDGQEVAQAKLGQTGGMRAVRLQTEPQLGMHELVASRPTYVQPLALDGAGGPETDPSAALDPMADTTLV